MTSVGDSSRRIYRWAFNCRQWEPLKEEIRLALAVVQSEEKNRILRFVFKEDAKRALVGRLLIRKCVISELQACQRVKSASPLQEHLLQEQQQQRTLVNSDFSLGRTAKGRPELILPAENRHLLASRNFDFNVSHSGDYAVLAAVSDDDPVVEDHDGESERNDPLRIGKDPSSNGNSTVVDNPSSSSSSIGIDVMKIEAARSKSLSDFFRLMRRQLTPPEWRHVEEAEEEEEKMKRFYRFWCLKESYVKALGIGIGFEVGRLQFTVEDELRTGAFCSSTTVAVDNRLEDGWRFDEMLLDPHHCVAIASKYMSTSHSSRSFSAESCDDSTKALQNLTITQLLDDFLLGRGSDSLASDNDWEAFRDKQTKEST